MQITSFAYLCFLIISLVVYYVIPKRVQWLVLLASSLVFFLYGPDRWLIVYPVGAAFMTYLSGIMMDRNDADDRIGARRAWMIAGVTGVLSLLIVLKYLNFPINTVNGISAVISGNAEVIRPFAFLVPIGISFYTLSLLEHIRNVYLGEEKAEHNFFKLLTFTMFFPCILSGPINRYRDFNPQLEAHHKFDYDRVTFGAQRILWGFFKVLVLSSRLKILTDTVYGDTNSYSGFFIIIAALAFTFELYMNFSGSIDIIMGTAECFDITLPENFKQPFFATSVQEFWRRWHITLGEWVKGFIFYPVLRSRAFTQLSDRLRAKYDKKKAKRRVNTLALLILWFTVGLWHGGAWNYIVGSGLAHWIFIAIEERFPAKKYEGTKGRIITFLRCVRTYILVSAAFIFFAASDLLSGIDTYGKMLTTFNPHIFTDGSLLGLGLSKVDMIVTFMSLIAVAVVSHFREKCDVRRKIAGYNIFIRWAIYLGLLFFVVIFGSYGPGYSAAEFIYQGF